MIDFNKLLSLTPEQRQENSQRMAQEYDQRLLEKATAFDQKLAEIENSGMQLSEWETQFVSTLRSSMEAKAISHSDAQRAMAFLSDAQIAKLNAIHSRIGSPASTSRFPSLRTGMR